MGFLAAVAGIGGPGLSFAQQKSTLAPPPRDEPKSAPSTTPSERKPGDVYRAVAAMVESGNIDQADALLRAELVERPDDELAAEALHELYKLPGVQIPFDPAEINRTLGQLGKGFRRYDTAHFVVLSDCDEAWTRQRASLLESSYHQFHRVMKRLGLESAPPRHRLMCVLIHEHSAYTSFAKTHDGVDAAWVAGYYASRTNRVVFYNDATGPAFRNAAQQIDQFKRVAATAERKAVSARNDRGSRDAHSVAQLREQAKRFREHLSGEQSKLVEQVEAASLTKTIHEAIHLIAFNGGLQSRAHQYPFWLTEGLASSFETLEPCSAFGPDTKMESRDREFTAVLADARTIPLGAFVQMNALAAPDAESARAMYAQAHSFFQYLFRFEREQLAAYFRDIQREPTGGINAKRHLAMFTARFGDPDRMERQWLRECERSILESGATAAADTFEE